MKTNILVQYDGGGYDGCSQADSQTFIRPDRQGGKDEDII